MRAWDGFNKNEMTAALADAIRDAERRGTPDLRDGETERAVWAAAFANAYLLLTQATFVWDEEPLRQWAAGHADAAVRAMRMAKSIPVEATK
jgi:hypothetical protein